MSTVAFVAKGPVVGVGEALAAEAVAEVEAIAVLAV